LPLPCPAHCHPYGSVAEKQEELEEVAVAFYKDLFTAQGDLEVGNILQHVQRKVTEEMNDMLMKPYTANEVKKVIFMMGPNKSLGPDGLTAGFFRYTRN
jgi:hypothetical protein